MTLSVGTRLGSFEIAGLLGVGGMGEVYRAKDTKLGREVAVKVLPEAFSKDKDRLARFEREARLLASLNHPNIAAIYDLQEAQGIRLLIMELVEGLTLAERLRPGPLSTEESAAIFVQIAEAVEAAHERGIIHRDLKPANIKVTPQGRVKVLDFGLAKAFQEPSAAPNPGGTLAMPKQSGDSDITTKASILGTPAYMSPEQARAEPLDKRTDIWAFGCCFFEALSGRRPFAGKTNTDMLAEVLKSEPDWSALPKTTPPKFRDLIQRCLQKETKNRLRDIGDARIVLHESQTPSISSTPGWNREAQSGAKISEGGYKAILFTRLIGSADLQQRLGVTAGAEAIARHDAIFRESLGEFNGSEMERTADGFYAAFDLPSEALRCALSFQQKLAKLDLPEPLDVGMGIHAGEIGRSEGPQESQAASPTGAIDVAARLMGLAGPRQILLTGGAYESARQEISSSPGGSEIAWLAHGAYAFKGMQSHLEVYEAGIVGLAALTHPSQTETAKRAVRPKIGLQPVSRRKK
ncbi:protein kinase [Candidatus Sumerlaeota bacterium]|nr:protein kinase [Candidatus Sumerlaeota bacterium]